MAQRHVSSVATLSITVLVFSLIGYSLVAGAGDADNDKFQITGNKLEVQSGVALDHEAQASYSVRVRTTDSESETHEEVFTVQVTDLTSDSIGALGADT